MQYDDLDDRTRNIIYNYIAMSIDTEFSKGDSFAGRYKYKEEDLLCRMIFTYVLGEKVDVNKHYQYEDLLVVVEKVLSNALYNEVFDLIEAICKFRYNKYEEKKLKTFSDTLNLILESEYVGYRIIDGRFTPITDKNEIAAIEEACDNTYQGPRTHISKAVALISDREHKDYKNCIKESISAVESLCSIIVGKEGTILSTALKQLEDSGLKIHPVLKNAFSKLYAYTCDEKGVRHAEGLLESEVTFEDAKFMLVSCCAFVNYLTANYGRVGGNHA